MSEFLSAKPMLSIDCFYSFFTQRFDRGFAFLGESHNFWECVLVLAGSLCVSGDERIYELSAGQIVFHKPNELHKFHVTSEEDANVLIFSFELSGDAAAYFRNKVFRLSDYQKSIVDNMLAYARKGAPAGLSQNTDYQNFSFEPSAVAPTYYPTLGACVCQLFYSLHEDSNEMAPSLSPAGTLFYTAVRYMNENLAASPSVNTIAARLGISSSGLKRLFRTYAGMPVHKYFLTLKINAATELLQSGASVCETAEKLGFSCQSGFSAAYKRELGKTPSQVKGT